MTAKNKNSETLTPTLLSDGPTYGDILDIRRAVGTALEVAALLLDAAPAGSDAARVKTQLLRLENHGGYLSDFQMRKLWELVSSAEAMAEDLGVPEEGFIDPLREAVDEVDLEVVALESKDVPVNEPGKGSGIEAFLLLVGLGLVAWYFGEAG